MGPSKENESSSIPAQSSKFSGEDRAEMLKEMMKCVPSGYPQALKGYDDGFIGPIKAELANVSNSTL